MNDRSSWWQSFWRLDLIVLYYERIDVSEGIDPTKSNRSKEFIICRYWFFNHGFKFQDFVYNGCYDLTRWSVNKYNQYYYCHCPKINVGTVMKIPEMLTFILITLKLKNM